MSHRAFAVGTVTFGGLYVGFRKRGAGKKVFVFGKGQTAQSHIEAS